MYREPPDPFSFFQLGGQMNYHHRRPLLRQLLNELASL